MQGSPIALPPGPVQKKYVSHAGFHRGTSLIRNTLGSLGVPRHRATVGSCGRGGALMSEVPLYHSYNGMPDSTKAEPGYGVNGTCKNKGSEEEGRGCFWEVEFRTFHTLCLKTICCPANLQAWAHEG